MIKYQYQKAGDARTKCSLGEKGLWIEKANNTSR